MAGASYSGAKDLRAGSAGRRLGGGLQKKKKGRARASGGQKLSCHVRVGADCEKHLMVKVMNVVRGVKPFRILPTLKLTEQPVARLYTGGGGGEWAD